MKQFLKERSNIAFVIAIILFIPWVILEIIGKGKSGWALVLAIAVLIFALTALFLPKRTIPVSNWNKFVNSSFPLLLALVLLPYFFERALNITWFPESIVAYGTLLLAVATYQFGQTTIDENKKIRDDNERVRKEELRLDAILRLRQWAERNLHLLHTTYPIMNSLAMTAFAQDPTNMRILNPLMLGQIGTSFEQIKTESFGAKADSKRVGGHVVDLTNDVLETITSLAASYNSLLAPSPKFDEIDKQQAKIIEDLNEILKAIAEE